MGILQIKRGETKPDLQQGEPFLDTKKNTLNIGEDLILSDPAHAAAGFGESLYGRILIINIEAATKKAAYYYAQPNAQTDIEIKSPDDKIYVIIGSGVTLDGETKINLSSYIKRAQVTFLPLVDFSENGCSVHIENAHRVTYEGGPIFKSTTNKQKIYGGKIELKGYIYFDDNGNLDGASAGVRLNGMMLDAEDSIFNITDGAAGEAVIKLNKHQNSFLKTFDDWNIYINARPIFTPDYPHASHIIGVEVQTSVTPDYIDDDSAVKLKPYGIDADGNKKYYPDISDACAVQFSIEIISLEDWADVYFDI